MSVTQKIFHHLFINKRLNLVNLKILKKQFFLISLLLVDESSQNLMGVRDLCNFPGPIMCKMGQNTNKGPLGI